jgi:hypothetical protein
MFAVVLAPLRVAVIAAEALAVTLLVDAVNVVFVELAGTVTEAGTVRDALFDDKPTAVAPERAAFDRVTVQVVLPLDTKLDAAHCRDDRLTGA